jgi:NAD(P)-dependent dehydrogenase (short-subunit alcohol dehydrogenase family)
MSNLETQSLFRLDGKVAIVTGAAGLLGEQHALALSDFGAHVVLADLSLDPCEKRADEIRGRGKGHAMAAVCDVFDKSSWTAMLESVLGRFGRVDILVNNAAYTNQSRSLNYGAAFSDFPVADWNAILGVNLTGTFLGCQVIGRQMLAQKAGSIINIASLYGVVSPNHRIYPGTGIAQPPAYAVSKAGVVALTRYLGTLWAERGVRVNCITPGGVFNQHTELFSSRYNALCPMGRMANKDEMRGAVVYLASDASAYCVGHNLVVDGGWTAW